MLNLLLAIFLSFLTPMVEGYEKQIKNSEINFQGVEITENLCVEDAQWEDFKQEMAIKASKTAGWCSKEKALFLMDFIREKQCQQCIEIGVFSGASLLPIAQTLKYNGSGLVYAIDAWSTAAATKGFGSTHPDYVWWLQLDYEGLYSQTVGLIEQNELQDYCEIIRQESLKAAPLFGDGTIDFIHFDGNHNEEYVLQDVVTYFSKLKEGGYLLLNNSNWPSMRQAIVFLLGECDVIYPPVRSPTYLLFRKKVKGV